MRAERENDVRLGEGLCTVSSIFDRILMYMAKANDRSHIGPLAVQLFAQSDGNVHSSYRTV